MRVRDKITRQMGDIPDGEFEQYAGRYEQVGATQNTQTTQNTGGSQYSKEQLQKAMQWDLDNNKGKQLNEIKTYMDTLYPAKSAEEQQFEAQKSKGTEFKTQALDATEELIKRDTRPITGTLQIASRIPGTSAQQSVALFNQLQGMMSLENRSYLKGTGQISDYEFKVLEQASSALNRKLSDTDFKKQLNKIHGILSKNVPGQESRVAPTPESPEAGKTALRALDFLIPGSQKRAERIQTSFESGDPKAALNEAFNPLASKESLSAAGSVAGYTILPKAVSKTLGPITKLFNKGATARAIKKAGQLHTESIIKVGNKFVSHEPNAKKLWDTVRPTISNETKASDLMEKMFDVWNRAFGDGKVKGNAEAQLYAKLYGAGRKVIEEQAPDLSKRLVMLRLKHTIPKAAQKVTWLLAKLGLAKGGVL